MKITIREPGSAITHLIGMILAAAATTPLLIKSALAGGSTLMALSIFCLSMVLLYGASTVYHSVNLKGSALKIFKKIDHKLDKLLYELNLINIDDEDNDSGNSEKIRDMLKEAEKFRLSIINNYKKYLGNSYITLTLKKMQIIIDGYKAKLYTIKERENEKILINMFNQMKIEEPEKKGKGR